MGFNQRLCGLVASACLLAASGCGGDGGEESVFLYFINAYPGTSKLSVSSARGSLVTNVPFGERYGSSGSCGPEAENCGPVRVDRSFSSEWSVRMEAMPEVVDLDKDLFSMYPQETGTVVFTQRSDVADVQASLFRHVQSIDDFCRITFLNGLAGDNTYVEGEGDGIAKFSFAEEWYFETALDIALSARIDLNESDSPFISECGPLPTTDARHDNLQRPTVLERIGQDPWFFYDCGGTEREPNVCIGRWGVRAPGKRAPLGSDGSFFGYRTSQEFYACVESAISIREEEGAIALPFPGVEPSCPPGPITWDDVDVDYQAVALCMDPQRYSTNMLEPGTSDTRLSYVARSGDSPLCESRFRIRAGGGDIIFGPSPGDDLGYHGNGSPLESFVDIPAGSERFYVLFGRPVNPLVWQWDSSLTFVDLSNFPYYNPNGDRPQVGDTDL